MPSTSMVYAVLTLESFPAHVGIKQVFSLCAFADIDTKSALFHTPLLYE